MAWTRIKICGITRPHDAVAAEAAGADAIGFVFWSKSPRCVSLKDAAEIVKDVPPMLTTVGVFVSPDADEVRRTIDTIGLNAVQLCGPITPSEWSSLGSSVRIIRSMTVEALNAGDERDTFNDLMLDSQSAASPGGTGEVFDWNAIPELPAQTRLWLAGGLTPTNVSGAIAAVRPYAVDVSSGVEDRPGIKSHEKIAQFVAAVRAADAKLPMKTA